MSSAADLPLSVFGLTLGQSNEVPECPFKRVGVSPMKLYDQAPMETCVEDAHALNGYQVPVRTFVFGKGEGPPIVKNWRAFLLEKENVLKGVHFLTPGVNSQDVVMQELISKYGAPTNRSLNVVKNLTGATFEVVSAQWIGLNVEVRFEGVGPKLTYGEVYIDLPEAAALRRSWVRDDRARERKL